MDEHRDMDSKDNEEEISFELEGQTVHFTRKIIDTPIDFKFTNLNDTDKAFMAYSLEDADDLLKMLPSGDKNVSNYTAKDLDELLYLWNTKKLNFEYVEETQFVNAIGAAFGQFLNKELDTTWTIISDEYGTDYSCKGTKHEFQLFPFSSVWKAIEQDREDSLNAIILIVKENIREMETN